MARPTLSLLTLTPQIRGWDAQAQTNFDRVKTAVLTKPFPICLVYKTTPFTDAVDIATLDAADYTYCYAHLTDPADVATDGRLIYSDGVDWKYAKSDATV